MLIAQSLAESGLLSAIVDGVYVLRVRVEELLGPPGPIWVIVTAAIVVAVVLIRR